MNSCDAARARRPGGARSIRNLFIVAVIPAAATLALAIALTAGLAGRALPAQAAPAPPPAPATDASTPPASARPMAPAPPVAAASGTASSQRLPTIQEVLARSVAARGGSAKLHAVKSRREIGRITLGPGNEWPIVVEHKRPASMRMEIALQGAKLIRAYDGSHGWQSSPQAANAEPLNGDDLHNIANEADFDGVLVDTSTKGKAELLGKETVGGRDAYKVQVTLLGGDVFTYFIDSATWLPIHWEGSRLISKKSVTFESDFSDYRDVEGVKYSCLILSSIKGSPQKQKIQFDRIEINPPIEDGRFAAPPPAASQPPAAVPPPATQPPATAPPAPPPPSKPPTR